MDPLTGSEVTAAVGLGSQLIAVMNYWLRLRWRGRQEQARRRQLAVLVRSLPSGSRLDEVRADGSELHLSITHIADHPEGELR